MKRKILLGTGLTIVLAAGGLVFAQPPGPPPPRGPGHFGPPGGPPGGPHGEFEPDPEMRAFMEHVMMARVSKELELDDEQTVLLVRRFVDIKEKTEKA